MGYWNDLAYELRARRCSEQQVLQVLTEARDTCRASGRTPCKEFGPTAEFASQYEGTVSATPEVQVLRVLGAVGLVGVVVYHLLRGQFGIEPPVLRAFGGFLWLLMMLLLGASVGSIIDSKLPRGFRE